MEVPALTSIKLSLLFFYRRIFITGTTSAVIWTLIATVVAWGTAFFALLILALGGCWAQMCFKSAPHGYGRIPKHFYHADITYMALDAVVDVAMLIIPMPISEPCPLLSIVMH